MVQCVWRRVLTKCPSPSPNYRHIFPAPFPIHSVCMKKKKQFLIEIEINFTHLVGGGGGNQTYVPSNQSIFSLNSFGRLWHSINVLAVMVVTPRHCRLYIFWTALPRFDLRFQWKKKKQSKYGFNLRVKKIFCWKKNNNIYCSNEHI